MTFQSGRPCITDDNQARNKKNNFLGIALVEFRTDFLRHDLVTKEKASQQKKFLVAPPDRTQ